MAGHSIGGASAATTMAGDQRVRAGANMDGSFMEPFPAEGLDGPTAEHPEVVFHTEG